MYGITGIMVKFFDSKDEMEINHFLCEYDGNIINVQYSNGKVMVIYKAMEE